MKAFSLFLLLIFIGPASAINVDIYYPNNNTTTEMYYSEGVEYNTILNNSISGNLSVLIIKDQKSCVDVFNSPARAVAIISGWMVVFFLGVLIIVIFTIIKRVVK